MRGTALVVGASLGGLRAAEQLRAHGFQGRLIVVGAETWMPYNRPPLSKEALLAASSDDDAAALAQSLAFRPRVSAEKIEWRLGSAARHADLEEHVVSLDDGSHVRFDGLVVATGLRPRRLPQPAPAGGRFVLRTVEDALELRSAVQPGSRVVVVGGGFIGCETAASLHQLGCSVTVVEPMAVPMMRGVGIELGAALMKHHQQAGVEFVTGQGVKHLLGQERVAGVVLDNGSVIACDLLVESVGSYPNTGWLEGNGLDLSDGLLCDNHLRVEGRSDVVAVGDVARFPNPRYDNVARRIEHWTMPTDTARRAAASLAASLSGGELDHASFAPLPAFWSDQFGLRLQSFGAPALADAVEVVRGDLNELAAGAVVQYLRKGIIVGVVLANVPTREHAHYRSIVGGVGATVG